MSEFARSHDPRRVCARAVAVVLPGLPLAPAELLRPQRLALPRGRLPRLLRQDLVRRHTRGRIKTATHSLARSSVSVASACSFRHDDAHDALRFTGVVQSQLLHWSCSIASASLELFNCICFIPRNLPPPRIPSRAHTDFHLAYSDVTLRACTEYAFLSCSSPAAEEWLQSHVRSAGPRCAVSSSSCWYQSSRYQYLPVPANPSPHTFASLTSPAFVASSRQRVCTRANGYNVFGANPLAGASVKVKKS
eukprot:1682838-Pleurochrysis_carterae.AAC.1